jgi:hypothetical protein
VATVRWILVFALLSFAVSGPALVGVTSAVFDGGAETVRQSGNSRAGSDSYEETVRPERRVRIDVYGNQIDDAMGDYRVDWSGDIYERHAPETEILKLPSPTL